jgi:hypothetical protein
VDQATGELLVGSELLVGGELVAGHSVVDKQMGRAIAAPLAPALGHRGQEGAVAPSQSEPACPGELAVLGHGSDPLDEHGHALPDPDTQRGQTAPAVLPM